ncbi:hypothetical protein C8A03DRAFT_47977 [Achaetomium macrosporum]|uniref:Uncharacterized protein n=1 Tax=Achaetomium macrosporum TaxID=79813 RepID=A0AAN7H3M2_9PEZI|nr:hypothetical protein C8A03DRAFT_47977 [Achaetomium macrosporum]
MTSLTTSNSSEGPATPASSEGECQAELVFEICQFRTGTGLILGFNWQASQVDDLPEQLDARLIELDQTNIRRFEYDYETETVYLDIMSECPFHYQLLVATEDTTIRDLIRSAKEQGTASIKYENKLRKQADLSFGQSETRQHVERKARQYIVSSDGKIRAVLILDLQYPGMKKAWVSLLAADDSASHWILHHELYHDDDLDQQPVGQVDLYLSDFVGLASLPAAYCRPFTAKLAAGIKRNPTINLTYERLRAIFRWARYLHTPKEFSQESGVAEERMETERRVAEARNEERIEVERRLAEERIKMERHITAEIERCITMETARRVAAGRSEAG